MDKNTIEQLRKLHELTYRQEDNTVVVVASDIKEVDATIKKYQEKGYAFSDSNRYGTMGEGTVGEFLVFTKKK